MGCRLLYIIDHDMTLVDTLGVFYRTFRDACKAHGARPPGLGEFIQGFCSDSLREPPGVDPFSFWSFFKDNYYARGPGDLRVMPGAREFLEELSRRGARVVVASGRGSPSVIRRELEAAGLHGLVEGVYTVGGGDFDKTSLFRRLREEWGLPCVAVGDYRMDLESAVKAGCVAVGVTAGCKRPESHRRAGAWVVFEDLRALLGFLDRVEERACQDERR